MLKYKVIINEKLEEKYMINIEKIDKIAASGNHELRLPKEYAELKTMLAKLKIIVFYTN